MTGKTQIIAPLAQVGPLQPRGQQRKQMIPTKRLGEGRVREDERRNLRPRRLRQYPLQHHRGAAYWRPLPRIEPRRDPLGLKIRERPAERLGRERPFNRTTPRQAGFAGWSGQVTGAQEMHCVAQLRGSLRTTRKRDTGLGRAQREPIPQQGVGHVLTSNHNMQVAQRGTRQKRNIFKGFSAFGDDPSGHPR